MADRPMSPPAAEIAAQAWDRYGAWLSKYEGDLADTEPEDRPFIYGHWRAVGCIDMAKAMTAVDRATGSI